MELSQISEVIELTSPDEVNQYLGLGWKLLHTYTEAYDTEPPRVYAQTLIYSLGWPGSNPQHPETRSKWNLKSDLDDLGE